MTNFYEILGVTSEAGLAEIKAAFRKLAKEFHPDKNPNGNERFETILKAYERLKGNVRFRVFPSLRFEYFLTLLKNAQFIIGNSSAGIREAPYYGIPIINVGTRQQNRSVHAEIINVDYSQESITTALQSIDLHKVSDSNLDFGQGNSTELFKMAIQSNEIWQINHQKQFKDI